MRLFREWRNFRRELRNFEPHLVHAHFGTMTSFFCAFGSAEPLVITFRGNDLNPVPGLDGFRNWFARLLSQISSLRAVAIICVSESLKHKLWAPWLRKGVTIIPVGVNLNLFELVPREKARLILGWGLEDRVVLFNAGRQRLKRLDLAKAAIAAARQQCDLRLEVLDGHIPPERIPIFLNAADCLILTSDCEGSPNIVKEAMACNLPVVSVSVGDVSERLKNVNPSRIVVRDPQALGRAIVEILAMRCRSNGRDAVIRDLDEKLIAGRIVSTYDQILSMISCSPRLWPLTR